MTMASINGFMALAEGKPVGVGRTYHEAVEIAAEQMAKRSELSIQTYAAPAPSRTWQYDYDVAAWVEQL
jgi:hypothetical protein